MIPSDRSDMFYFLRSSFAHRTSLYVGGCSIILIGRIARITAPHRAARLWERVEVVLTFWKMAAARALASSMTSPRNRLLSTVPVGSDAHATRGPRSSARPYLRRRANAPLRLNPHCRDDVSARLSSPAL